MGCERNQASVEKNVGWYLELEGSLKIRQIIQVTCVYAFYGTLVF